MSGHFHEFRALTPRNSASPVSSKTLPVTYVLQLDDPFRCALVPSRLEHLVAQLHVLAQVVLLDDALPVREDFDSASVEVRP